MDFLPNFDGQIHRFVGASKKSKSGWYCGFDSGEYKYLVVGDWASGSQPIKWSSRKKYLKSEEFHKFILDSTMKAKAQKAEVQKSASAEAKRHFEKNKISADISSFEYCRKKKIPDLFGASFCEDSFGVHIAIPLYFENEVVSVQKIYSDGTKRFLYGGKKRGCYFILGNMQDDAYLCEGYATAVSIHLATKKPVIVAFDAGNIDPVCEVFKDKKITIAADNDQFSQKNVGVVSANAAGMKFGFPVVVPKFDDLSGNPTDFNDLFCISGADAVTAQLNIVKGITVSANNTSDDMLEFVEYKMLFEKIFPNAKKCVLTGEVTYPVRNMRNPVLNHVKLARADAMIAGLERGKVEDYLHKWIKLMPESLLCNVGSYGEADRDYIGELLSYVSVSNIDHEYFVELMKGWLAGIFNRLKDNHAQNKMVILGGEQGLGKDTFIYNMLKSIDPYFANTGIHEKETENYGVMARNLVINVSEFDRTSRIQVSQIKNIITAYDATFRAPYAQSAQTVSFRTSFISSCNIEDIFRDETGNRRFMYFKLEDINWNYPKNLSEKVIAQAKHLSDSGYEPSDAAVAAMDKILAQMTPDSWEIFADDMWQARVNNLIQYNQNSKLTYADIAPIVREISMSLGVSIRMVQGYVRRSYQYRDEFTRYYRSAKNQIDQKISIN